MLLKSLVRENRTQGSVRGAPGNWRPYRDAEERTVKIDISPSRNEIVRHKDDIVEMLLDFSPSNHVAWKNTEDAAREVEESLREDVKRISIVALADGRAVG